MLVVGFPLGVHDTLHRLPVARQSVIASAFGIRFQGKGYFLTDARLHRGMSGAPVVAREAESAAPAAPSCPGCCSACMRRASTSPTATPARTKAST